jgi:hypothetical protein
MRVVTCETVIELREDGAGVKGNGRRHAAERRVSFDAERVAESRHAFPLGRGPPRGGHGDVAAHGSPAREVTNGLRLRVLV